MDLPDGYKCGNEMERLYSKMDGGDLAKLLHELHRKMMYRGHRDLLGRNFPKDAIVVLLEELAEKHGIDYPEYT